MNSPTLNCLPNAAAQGRAGRTGKAADETPATAAIGQDAKVYREAAKRSLITGDGLAYLERYPKLYRQFWHHHDAMRVDDQLIEAVEFCMALLMLAAMADEQS